MRGKGRLLNFLFVTLRIVKYKLLSNCKLVKKGKFNIYHPLLMRGEGSIEIGDNFQNGVINSVNYYSQYNYLEARGADAKIIIGNNVSFSNNISVMANNRIVIKDNVIIGFNTTISDYDGHDSAPEKRHEPHPLRHEVVIEDNVLIYSNVFITKGVTIGKNSIVGAGSVVTQNIPENVIAAGNPARVIKKLD